MCASTVLNPELYQRRADSRHSCSHQRAVCRVQGSDPLRQQLELNIQDVFDFAWPWARADVLESVLVQRVPVITAGDAIGFDAIGHSNLFWVSAQLTHVRACGIASCHNSSCHWWLWSPAPRQTKFGRSTDGSPVVFEYGPGKPSSTDKCVCRVLVSVDVCVPADDYTVPAPERTLNTWTRTQSVTTNF